MTTNTSSADCQVLVVGAGPTGLTLAAQLLARGIRTRIIDKGAGPAPQSRALGIHARTLELLDTMGLADTFIERGHRASHLRMYAGTRKLLDLNLANNGSRYGFVLHLPQRETELLLRARVQELGGTIEQGVELLSLAERGDAVDATLRDGAGHEVDISAGYVVGCDGAHSRVRHELGLAFDGQPYPQDWLLADVALEGAGSDDAVHFVLPPEWAAAGLHTDGRAPLARGHGQRRRPRRPGRRPSTRSRTLSGNALPGPSRSPTRCGWHPSGASCARPRRTGAAASSWPAMPPTSTRRRAVRA